MDRCLFFGCMQDSRIGGKNCKEHTFEECLLSCEILSCNQIRRDGFVYCASHVKLRNMIPHPPFNGFLRMLHICLQNIR